MILGLLSPFYPPIFQAELKAAARAIAWRDHFGLKIGSVTGSLWEPITLEQISITTKSPAGTVSVLDISSAQLAFSWKNVLLKRGVGWFQKLTLDGVNMQVTLPKKSESTGSANSKRERRLKKLPLPVELEAQRMNLVISQGTEFVKLKELQFTLQSLASGPLLAKEIIVHRESWEKRFSQVFGAVALQDEKIIATDVQLEPSLTIDTLSVELPELQKGHLKSEFELKAFAGTFQGELQSTGHEGGRLSFDATGRFMKISMGQLVRFLSSDETASGVIKEGKFSFHGSPHNLTKATISTRFEAFDFQWRNRKWNSLVVSASLFDRRLQIPEFELKQAKNSLSMNGEMTLPEANQPWWQSDFTCALKAKLDSVTDLSALLGPDIGEAAGQATVEGNVRAQKGSYNGQFIISGNNLSYRSAPLDMLNAAVTLRDKEIEISHAEFAHKDDYLRARGVVTYSGQQRYSGEIKASIADLSLYASILRPPIAPYPFSGSLMLDWSGDGATNNHSGAFRARLKDVRPLVSNTKTPAYSIDADMEATYAPEHLYFNKLMIGEPNNAFSAKVTADPASIHLEQVKVQQGGTTRLEGDALLPLNIWKAWENPARMANWDFTKPCNVTLNFKKLNLHESSAIFGREFPVNGEVQGSVVASGSLSQIDIQGRLSLSQGQLPISVNGSALKGIEASVLLNGNTVWLEKFAAKLDGDEFSLDGRIEAANLQDPSLSLIFRSKSITVAPRPDLKAKTELVLDIAGPMSRAGVTGEARLTQLSVDHPISLEDLFFGSQQLNWGVTFDISHELIKNWNVDVHLTGSAATEFLGSAGNIEPDARLIGVLGDAKVTGKVDLADITASAPDMVFKVDNGTIYLPVNPADEVPSVIMVGHGVGEGIPFKASVLGSISTRSVVFDEVSPMNEMRLRQLASGGGGVPELAPMDFQLTGGPSTDDSVLTLRTFLPDDLVNQSKGLPPTGDPTPPPK